MLRYIGSMTKNILEYVRSVTILYRKMLWTLHECKANVPSLRELAHLRRPVGFRSGATLCARTAPLRPAGRKPPGQGEGRRAAVAETVSMDRRGTVERPPGRGSVRRGEDQEARGHKDDQRGAGQQRERQVLEKPRSARHRAVASGRLDRAERANRADS